MTHKLEFNEIAVKAMEYVIDQGSVHDVRLMQRLGFSPQSWRVWKPALIDIYSIHTFPKSFEDDNAGTGSIEIDNAIITAIRSATFNHSDGTVVINGTTIMAPILNIGGFGGASGTTNINAPDLRAKGSSIRGGKRTGIRIKGNAGIKMS